MCIHKIMLNILWFSFLLPHGKGNCGESSDFSFLLFVPAVTDISAVSSCGVVFDSLTEALAGSKKQISTSFRRTLCLSTLWNGITARARRFCHLAASIVSIISWNLIYSSFSCHISLFIVLVVFSGEFIQIINVLYFWMVKDMRLSPENYKYILLSNKTWLLITNCGTGLSAGKLGESISYPLE